MNDSVTINSDTQTRSWLDRAGIVASTTCAVHCAICALLPGVLAAAGLAALIGHEAEWMFTLVAVAFALWAAKYGFTKHRDATVLALLGVGMVGLLASRGLEEWGAGPVGAALGISAGVVLVFGHLSNLRALRRRKNCSHC